MAATVEPEPRLHPLKHLERVYPGQESSGEAVGLPRREERVSDVAAHDRRRDEQVDVEGGVTI